MPRSTGLRMRCARPIVVGLKVNTPLLRALVEHPQFRAGNSIPVSSTVILARCWRPIPPRRRGRSRTRSRRCSTVSAGASPAQGSRRRVGARWHDPWSANDGFSLGPPRTLPIDIIADGVTEAGAGDVGTPAAHGSAIDGVSDHDVSDGGRRCARRTA